MELVAKRDKIPNSFKQLLSRPVVPWEVCTVTGCKIGDLDFNAQFGTYGDAKFQFVTNKGNFIESLTVAKIYRNGSLVAQLRQRPWFMGSWFFVVDDVEKYQWKINFMMTRRWWIEGRSKVVEIKGRPFATTPVSVTLCDATSLTDETALLVLSAFYLIELTTPRRTQFVVR